MDIFQQICLSGFYEKIDFYNAAFSVVSIMNVFSSDRNIRIALVQAKLELGDVDANIEAFEQRVSSCKDCDIIVFPELFTSGCEMKVKDKSKAKDMKDSVAGRYQDVISSMRKWAKESGALVVGSTIYKENEKYYNRLLAVSPDGSFEIYDKHNCFKKGAFSPGEGRLIMEWKSVRLATFICYDLRFPEWSRNDNDYDIAIYIANWPFSRSEDWNNLLKERAKENKAFVVAVNCVGEDRNGTVYKGESCVIAPDGNVTGKCEDFKEDIKIVELNLD